ncbi:MAG TPA: hypothetical protein VH835_10445, partial [Dongiaceae bacterium]
SSVGDEFVGRRASQRAVAPMAALLELPRQPYRQRARARLIGRQSDIAEHVFGQMDDAAMPARRPESGAEPTADLRQQAPAARRRRDGRLDRCRYRPQHRDRPRCRAAAGGIWGCVLVALNGDRPPVHAEHGVDFSNPLIQIVNPQAEPGRAPNTRHPPPVSA